MCCCSTRPKLPRMAEMVFRKEDVRNSKVSSSGIFVLSCWKSSRCRANCRWGANEIDPETSTHLPTSFPHRRQSNNDGSSFKKTIRSSSLRSGKCHIAKVEPLSLQPVMCQRDVRYNSLCLRPENFSDENYDRTSGSVDLPSIIV